MKTFKVTYSNDVVETISTLDCETVAQFIAMKFGGIDPTEHGCTIHVDGEPDPEVETISTPDEEAATEPL